MTTCRLFLLAVFLASAAAGTPAQAIRVATTDTTLDDDEIGRAEAFVADYDKRFGGTAVLRRGQKTEEIRKGVLLFDGDVVEIVLGQPYVLIDSYGSQARVKLSEDNRRMPFVRIETSGNGHGMPSFLHGSGICLPPPS